jgi:HEAT repeat protein
MEYQHQQLQESEAAKSLLQQLPRLSDNQLKQQYLNYLQWTEPLVPLLLLVDEKAPALRVVKLALEIDWQLGAKLAGAVKSEFHDATVDLLAELDIPQLLKIRLLGITGSDSAIPSLLQALNNQDSGVRRSAAYELGQISSEAAVAALGQALNHEDSEVRSQAAYELGQIGSEAAVAALHDALDDQEYQVRESAASALGSIGTDAAVAALRIALNDENFEVRGRIASVLGQIRTEAAVTVLQQALNDQVYQVRESAALGLGSISTDAAVAALCST